MTSLRARLRRILLGGLLAVLVVGGFAVFWMVRINLTTQFDDGLTNRARTIASLVVREPRRLVFESDEGPADTLDDVFFELYTVDGELLKRTANLNGRILDESGEFEEHAPMRFGDLVLSDGSRMRATWLTFLPRLDLDDDDDDDEDEWGDSDEEFGAKHAAIEQEWLVVVVAMHRESMDRAMMTLLTALLIVGGFILVTTAALVTFGIRSGLSSIDHLTDQMGSVDCATISTRFDASGAPRELLPIYEELNRMLERVEHTLEREVSFAEASAHELRTPLAELRAAAEVALRWPDAKRTEATLREVLEIGVEMESLVESLLAISRGDAGIEPGDVEPSDIAPIIRAHVDRVRDTARSRQLQLDVDVEDAQPFRVPREALDIIVRNLVENAVDYAPTGSRVSISSNGVVEGIPELVVENEVALSKSDLDRLFDPFWRFDSARTDRRHAGLGLAVVRRVAEVTGLEINASLDDGRLRMRVHDASRVA